MHLAQAQILQCLLDFVNSGVMKIPKGYLFSSEGNPLAFFANQSIMGNPWEITQENTRNLLKRLISDGNGWVIDKLNERGLTVNLYEDGHTGEVVIVPCATMSSDLPWVILFIAVTTKSGYGDTLAERVRSCGHCQKFFLQRTRRHSGFCGDRCRWKHASRTKKSPDGGSGLSFPQVSPWVIAGEGEELLWR